MAINEKKWRPDFNGFDKYTIEIAETELVVALIFYAHFPIEMSEAEKNRELSWNTPS